MSIVPCREAALISEVKMIYFLEIVLISKDRYLYINEHNFPKVSNTDSNNNNNVKIPS